MQIRRYKRRRQNNRHGFQRGRTENSRFHARYQRKTGGRLGRNRKPRKPGMDDSKFRIDEKKYIYR